ncbi:hypothetical protein F6U93_08235 [Tamlana haliotis]|uniref:YARHG domain-containing protein n=1 Tax=Pseudotamlana haliotis TaxID=2614804 RepID=A0A6N6MGP7_9FLAO|nr:hypothetical protein [Tamlana haliotis]KAB1068114.1 hypothetical protein F6U93_08235 [Tamlana haliotis]
MKKLRITVLAIFFSINLFSQDTIGVPNDGINYFSKLQSELNEPAKQFPIIKLDSLKGIDFEMIKSSALEIEKKLDLVFIKYYSENNVDWNKKDYTNHFEVKSKIKEQIPFSFDYINFEIDSLKNQTILTNEPCFKSGTSIRRNNAHTTIAREIIPENYDSINYHGNFPVKINYLIAYDTIKLSKKDIGKEFKVAEEKYRLDNFFNGNVYIRSLDASNKLDKVKNWRYITYKNQKVVHLPEQNNFPLRFQKELKTSSVILNDSLIQLPLNTYKNYLKNLKVDKNKVFSDQLILATKVEFDEIYILFPNYNYLNKQLKESRIEKINVDKLHKIQLTPDKTNKMKTQPIDN